RGACPSCLGALTISGTSSVRRNVAYYIIGRASKFARPGSTRIGSTNSTVLPNVAFRTPQGQYVLIVLNNGSASQNFNIKINGKQVSSSLNKGAVGTYVW